MKKRKKKQYEPADAYVGRQFGKLTIIGVIPSCGCISQRDAICACQCGKTKRDDGSPIRINLLNVINGRSKSCGCLWKENTANGFRPQDSGLYAHEERLYIVWGSMIARCYNPNRKEYPSYGGRGITVCKMWRDSYKNFRKWALAHGYNPNAEYGECTLDRIDNNRGYQPSNCRWVDVATQSKNKVNTKKYKYHNREMNAKGWSKKLDVPYDELKWDLYCGKTIGSIIREKNKKIRQLLPRN